MAKRSKAARKKLKANPVAETKSPRKRRRRRLRSNPSGGMRNNPPLFTELAEYVLPGFGGFAATKFITRTAAAQIAKRWPKHAKHASAVSSIGTFLAAWFLGNRWKVLARYHTPVVVGSAIATLQSLVQLYAPNKLGWIVGDPHQAIAIGQRTAAVQAAALAPAPAPALPDHLEEVNDDPAWYTYNDAYDAGRYKGQSTPTTQAPAPMPDAPETQQEIDDEELAAGIFGGNALGN